MDNEKARINLVSKLRKEREKARLTQAEVATASGIGINYYAQIERGEVNFSVEKLLSIMKKLKIKSIDI
jgi:transcriptional regulator with XRE-family HTH domain